MTAPDNQQATAPRTGSRNLAVIDETEASAEVKRLYAQFRKGFGRPQVPGILKCFATHPPLLEHMLGLAQDMLFVEGALRRRQKELIATFVSSGNDCAYCADSHGASLCAEGGRRGMLEAALAGDTEAEALPAAERTLLRFARKVTEHSNRITAADMGEMRAAGWSDLQIAETIHITALFACFNRVVNAFGLPSQEMLAAPAADGGGAR